MMTYRGAPRRLQLVAIALALLATSCMPPSRPALTAADTDDVARIAAYLNSLPRFQAHFVQSGTEGAGAGLIWLDRPGHLRIDYAGPAGRVMVIAGGRVRVLDRNTGATTTMPLSRTPLGLLLGPTIDLSATGPAHVDSLVHGPGQIRIVLTKATQPGLGTLAMDFQDRPLRLEAVTVTNPYHAVLTMQLTDIDPAAVMTPVLFEGK